MEYTLKLVEFCADLRYGDIPADVLRKTKLCILDNLGTILAASNTVDGQRIAEFVNEMGDRPESTILGFGFKTSSRSAAFANASLSEILELQDGWRYGNDHPCVVIPAALAVAEQRNVNGRDLLTSIVVGYEATNRIAAVMHPTHLAKGFLPTGTAGTCGSALAVGKLLNFDRELMLNALGIAAFLLPISTAENLWGGYTIKPAHSGQAARMGIESAMLAERGFTACPLEGPPGRDHGFPNLTSDNPKFDRLVEGLGERYTVKDVYFKVYPACRHAHGAAEATLQAVASTKIAVEEIKEVIVETYSLAAKLLGDRRTTTSSTPVACQFSIPYVTSVAIIDRAVTPGQFSSSRIRDSAVHSLAAKVRVSENEELTNIYPDKTATIVRIRLIDGRGVISRVDLPKGDPRNPVTEEELLGKFKDLTSEILSQRRATEVISAILALEDMRNISELMDLLPSYGEVRS
ncbi:MAG: MmgE/PrpD family protein [Chloroflexi bacterium]|nr:MmgE/PrpD family protein [Chloroflexota bacterium]MCL5075399.1 MmgE/PrpD family protein [Chloroflexota bacterium]